MSRASPVWRRLGLAPTADGRAIRSAYAARLKAIDPDTDPQAFHALREDYEQALAMAAWIAREPAQDAEEGEEEESGQDADRQDADRQDAGPLPHEDGADRDAPGDRGDGATDAERGDNADRDTDWDDDWDDDGAWTAAPPRFVAAVEDGEDGENQPERAPDPLAAPIRDLQAILFGGEGPLDADETDRLSDAATRLLEAFTLVPIDQADEIERWLCYALIESSPRSDAVLLPIARAFGWHREAGTYRQTVPVGFVVSRARAVHYRETVIAGSRASARAWHVLSAPPAPRRLLGDLIDNRAIRRLLLDIRTNHPMLENDLDADTVADWEGRGAASDQLNALVIRLVFIAPLIAGAIARTLAADPMLQIDRDMWINRSLLWLYPLVAIALTGIAVGRRWRPRHAGDDPAPQAAEAGGLITLFALPLLAVVPPASIGWLLVFAALACGAAVLATDGDRPPRPDEKVIDLLRRCAWPLFAMTALWWGVSEMSWARWMQIMLPLAALAWVSIAIHDRAMAWQASLPANHVRMARVAVLAASAALSAYWFARFGLGPAPAGLYAAVAVALIGQHLLSPSTADPEQQINRFIFIPFLPALRFGAPAILAVAALLFVRTLRLRR